MKEYDHRRGFRKSWICLVTSLTFSLLLVTWAVAEDPNQEVDATFESILITMGDSLTHGTLDGANNWINSLSGYAQRVADSLNQVSNGKFVQPLFSEQEERLFPFTIPTNLAVDGADAFSLEGIQYYKRAGTTQSFINPGYLADKLLPGQLQDKYEKVLYPINVLAGRPLSQVGAANWLLDQVGQKNGRALVIFWVGSNESSTASLGVGASNPTFVPVPLEQVWPVFSPALRLLMGIGEAAGVLSFDVYTLASIERNLTELPDFAIQYNRLLNRLKTENSARPDQVDFLLLTLPYYSSVGYLIDSEDLEFYLQKVDPTYTVPPTFKRVSPDDPTTGDRISLLTFGLMYGLLDSGFSVSYVNQVLEEDGIQRDGLVLSEAEQQFIASRIDGYNQVIKNAAEAHGPNFHLVDIGAFMNDGLNGEIEIKVGDRVLSRKWIRGSSFSLDGVHPGRTGHALLANFILEEINDIFGLNAPLHDLEVFLQQDPYVDQDLDGWAPGPNYQPTGFGQVLFFFNDPNDQDPAIQPDLPEDFWEQVSNILLSEILDIPPLQAEARRRGIRP